MTRREWEIVWESIKDYFYTAEDDYERLHLKAITDKDMGDFLQDLEWKGVTISDLPPGEGPRLTSVREAVQNSQRGV